MARVFAVTTSTDRLRLDSAGRGEVTFSVSNSEKRLLRSRTKVVPLGTAKADWFTLAGNADEDLSPDASHAVVVRIAVPPTASGTFNFRIKVVSVDDEGDWADGPVVALEAAPTSGPVNPPRLPWWLLYVVGAVVLGAGGLAAYLLWPRLPGLNQACRDDKCATGLLCGAKDTCLGDAGYRTCKGDGDCAFGVCKNGQCGKRGLGLTCEDAGECAEGLDCVALGAGSAKACLGKVGFEGCKQNADCVVSPCLVGKCEADRTNRACKSSGECSPHQICSPTREQCVRERDQPCEAPGFCASNICTNGTCQSPGLGQACQQGTCDAGLRCVNGACLRDVNQACTSNPDCADDLCRRGVCVADATGLPCSQASECSHGQACDGGICQQPDGRPCSGDLQCLSQKCQGGQCVRLPVDSPCVSASNCASGRCLDSHCFQIKAEGEACTRNEECNWLRCVKGVCGRRLDIDWVHSQGMLNRAVRDHR